MKIRIDLAVDVDPEIWEQTYGTPAGDAKAIRDDVRQYVLGYVQGSAAADEGAITRAILKGGANR